MRAKLAILLLVCGLVLSGCGGSKEAKDAAKAADGPVSVAEGDCFGGATVADAADELATKLKTKQVKALRDDPTWADPVDCAKPHRIFVYGVVGLSKAVDKEVTGYAQLLNTESKLYEQVRNEVNRACSLKVPGVRKALKKTDLKLQITPALNSDLAHLTFNALPAANWEEGQRQFACLMTMEKPATYTLADFLTVQGKDSSLHLCYDPQSQPVACKEPHTMESVAVITANEAVAEGQLPDETGFVNGTLEVDPDVWDGLDRVCATFLRANSNLPKGLTGVTSLYDSQWPVQGTEDFAFYCDATSPYNTPQRKQTRTTGSVFNR
ncbi:MAG TPA: septum formation family protein [Marmoricola sp.]|nr:septum formation family protein [Marmoricola sp.]